MEEKISIKKNFLKGIIQENPVFVSLLAMCPTLAVTTSIESAIGMGVLFTLVLICSNVIISLLRKVVPSQVKIPVYIVIIATFVTMVKMLTEAFLPELYQTLGVFISLIVVNCIILGRAEAFASKNGPFASFIDAVGMSIGFTLALIVMAFFRELLGTGGFTFGKVFTFIPLVEWTPLATYKIDLFTQAPGGFLTLGLILAFMAFMKNHKEEGKIRAEKARIEALKQEKAKKLAAEKAAAANKEVA